MITHIKLENIATYSNPVNVNFKSLNFIYGGNGTGKTTISKLIAGEVDNPSCKVEFDNQGSDSIDKVLVYNKSFVENNFRNVGQIAGIFTLGREAGDALDIIKTKELELENIRSEIKKRSTSIESFQQNIRQLDFNFETTCWTIKLKYDKIFPLAMTGTRGSKRVFSQKCLREYELLDGTTVKSIDELQTLYLAAYTKGAPQYNLYDQLDLGKVCALDKNQLLKKSITGKADSDIGRFIEYLGASDWVRQGTEYVKHSNGKCPFCSQTLPQSIYSEIESFFDESYQRECNELSHYVTDYSNFHGSIIKYLSKIIAEGYDILSYENLQNKFSEYQHCVEKNQSLIQRKIETPSMIVEIEPCFVLLTEINSILFQFNTIISENNNLVEHQKESQKECQNEVWRLIANELSNTIKEYLKLCNGQNQAIKNCENQKYNFTEREKSILEEINEKKLLFQVFNIQFKLLTIFSKDMDLLVLCWKKTKLFLELIKLFGLMAKMRKNR